MNHIEKSEKFKQDLKELPEPKKTLLEIMKVHDKEVPMANLLAYFFRNKETHGLDDLFIQALLLTSCTELKKETNNEETNNEETTLASLFNISDDELDLDGLIVKTEEPTEGDKRIDLLIVAKSFVICLEFKINHDLDNPLENYKKFINGNEHYNNKKKIFIVLTPYSKEPVGKAKTFIVNNDDFKQIILSKFISTVKERLPDNYNNTYFSELIQTIENREIRFKRSYLLGELNKKIAQFTFHNNNKGGFLELKKQNYSLKIRIEKVFWKMEYWMNNKMKDARLFELNLNADDLKKELNNFINDAIN